MAIERSGCVDYGWGTMGRGLNGAFVHTLSHRSRAFSYACEASLFTGEWWGFIARLG